MCDDQVGETQTRHGSLDMAEVEVDRGLAAQPEVGAVVGGASLDGGAPRVVGGLLLPVLRVPWRLGVPVERRLIQRGLHGRATVGQRDTYGERAVAVAKMRERPDAVLDEAARAERRRPPRRVAEWAVGRVAVLEVLEHPQAPHVYDEGLEVAQFEGLRHVGRAVGEVSEAVFDTALDAVAVHAKVEPRRAVAIGVGELEDDIGAGAVRGDETVDGVAEAGERLLFVPRGVEDEPAVAQRAAAPRRVGLVDAVSVLKVVVVPVWTRPAVWAEVAGRVRPVGLEGAEDG